MARTSAALRCTVLNSQLPSMLAVRIALLFGLGAVVDLLHAEPGLSVVPRQPLLLGHERGHRNFLHVLLLSGHQFCQARSRRAQPSLRFRDAVVGLVRGHASFGRLTRRKRALTAVGRALERAEPFLPAGEVARQKL